MSSAPGCGQVADRRSRTASAVAGDPLEHPLQHAAVLAVAGPQEAAVVVAAEPVDEEDLRQVRRRRWSCRSSASGRSSRPCCSRRTAASPSGRSAGCRRRPAAAAVVSLAMIEPRNTPCSQSNAWVTSGTVVRRRPPNRMAQIGTPAGSSHSGAIARALRGRGGEAGVRVGGRRVGLGRPRVALPVGGASRLGVAHALPPHVALAGERGVGEDAVAPQRCPSRWRWCPSRCRGRRRRSRPRG